MRAPERHQEHISGSSIPEPTPVHSGTYRRPIGNLPPSNREPIAARSSAWSAGRSPSCDRAPAPPPSRCRACTVTLASIATTRWPSVHMPTGRSHRSPPTAGADRDGGHPTGEADVPVIHLARHEATFRRCNQRPHQVRGFTAVSPSDDATRAAACVRTDRGCLTCPVGWFCGLRAARSAAALRE